MSNYPSVPWVCDPPLRDSEGYRVIRGANGAPVAFVERGYSLNKQEDIARLLTASPLLLMAVRRIFFATASGRVPDWTEAQWASWRKDIAPVLADLWPTDGEG